jgi:hypothetical protein
MMIRCKAQGAGHRAESRQFFSYHKKVRRDTPHILLINPWIHDFAAYDFWAKPLGLLYLAAVLRMHGFAVSYLDCLDRFHRRAVQTDPFLRCGRGPYLKSRIQKPAGIGDVTRTYSRYGIKKAWFREDLQSVAKPDLILVTSGMTYWYSGVKEAIAVLREMVPNTPIVLGGVYPALWAPHAVQQSGADRIYQGVGAGDILQIAADATGFRAKPTFNPKDLNTYPYPAYDLQTQIGYIPILTSTGCPFSCAYCASSLLNPKSMRRAPESVIEEICFWRMAHGVRDFVFYDDALLMDPENHAIALFEGICRLKADLRFHTPNAVHIRKITGKLASLMFRSGMKTLRLGLETAEDDPHPSIDPKVTLEEFRKAARLLLNAGFTSEQVGAYLLVGLPGQRLESVVASIRTVKQCGLTPVPAYYTPIPGTALWPAAVASSRYDLQSDPVFTNNSVFPCQKEPFSWKTVSIIKQAVEA